MIICAICGDDFDPNSKEKKLVGGIRNHCSDYAEETSVRYAGISSGEGKQASVQVLILRCHDSCISIAAILFIDPIFISPVEIAMVDGNLVVDLSDIINSTDLQYVVMIV